MFHVKNFWQPKYAQAEQSFGAYALPAAGRYDNQPLPTRNPILWEVKLRSLDCKVLAGPAGYGGCTTISRGRDSITIVRNVRLRASSIDFLSTFFL